MPGANAPELTARSRSCSPRAGTDKEGAKVRFPTLNYLDEDREALAYHHEKVSGTKAEMLARIAGVCARLYEKHEKKLRKLFANMTAGGSFVRLNYDATDPGRCFDVKLEPRSSGGNGIADTPLRAP